MSVAANPLRRTLVYLGAALLALEAGIHLQQYMDFIKDIDKIGPLFLLNALGGFTLALGLVVVGERAVEVRGKRLLLRDLLAMAGIGMTLGALVSIGIALQGQIFGYSEPIFRPAVALAVSTELCTLFVLGGLLTMGRSVRAQSPEAA